MPHIQRIKKPKTRRGKRFLESREPKIIEDAKSCICLRGQNCSEASIKTMKDFCALKKPNCVYYSSKKDYLPFENINPIEQLLQKQDSSLFMFGSHNKKRPNNLIIGRLYDNHLLDMVEFGIENFKSLDQFKVPKVMHGSKPLLIFSGEEFEQDKELERIKNLFIDLFRGEEVKGIRLMGIEHVISFTYAKGKIHFRSLRIMLKKSGTKTPRVELEEIGPHLDLTVRRKKLASDDLFKLARRVPATVKPRKVKNIKRNPLGSVLGKIHMQRQDYAKLSTRKMKGLKKQPGEKKKVAAAKTGGLKRKADESVGEAKKIKT